jgi:hypothetical protein
MQCFPLAFCVIVFRHAVGLLWTSDQPIAKASTYIGQHTIETQTSMPEAGFESMIPVTKRPGPTPLTARAPGWAYTVNRSTFSYAIIYELNFT